MLSNPSPKRDHKLKKALVPAFTPHNGIDISPSDDDSLEKDETEERLENLIFGDDSGFHEALKSHGHGQTDLVRRKSSDAEGGSDSQGELRDNSALEGLEDADLFFLDSGAVPIEKDIIQAPTASDSEDDRHGRKPPAWEDSDDERIMVSLATNPRLRKLRTFEGEDLVNGKEYTKRLRRQFERLYPVPEWANPSAARHVKRGKRRRGSESEVSSSEDSGLEAMDIDSGDEDLHTQQPLAKLLQNVGNLTRSDDSDAARRKLRPEVLDIQRTKDVGGSQPSSVDSLSFHPHYPLLLSSGPASTLYLHHISSQPPTPNPLLTSLHLRHTPLYTTTFAPPSGSRIFLSGRRRYFHIWDLDTGKIEKIKTILGHKDDQKTMERFKLSPCGRWMGLIGSSKKGGGVVNVLYAKTLQWVAQVRIDSRGGVADFAWWSDGEGMAIAGKSGEISEWDGRENRVVARWVDEGAVGTTVLSFGGKSGRTQLGGDRWVAVGSSSGIVNIYDRRAWGGGVEEGELVPRNPKPMKVFEQLTTPTSHLIFSPDGQLMVMSSRWKRDALRLVHLPTCTVYRNWPTANTPFGRIASVAFSPTSNMLAVGNEQGKIRLWEIHG